MPKQTTVSGLAARIKAKAKKQFDQAKTTEPVYDTAGNLPGGIEGGIAQLVDCCVKKIKPGRQNAGEMMFYAAGVVVSPEEHAGIKIRGLRTSITENLFDTPQASGRKTFGEHLDWVLNELKKLGADLSEVSEDDVEGVMETLKEEQPHFRFRTWKGQKQTTGPYKDRDPRVNHVWGGHCEYVEGEENEGVVDETAEAQADDEVSDGEAEGGDETNLAALAEAADGGDEDSQRELEKLAKEAGVDSNDYPTWAEVAGAMSSESSEGEEEGEEEEPFKPVVGEVYAYKAPGKKKAVDHEVVAVVEKAKTVSMKNLADGKTIKGVSWSDLAG